MIGFYSNDDDDDDDGFMAGTFEEELANMDREGDELLVGEGPENQQTNIKWVHF